MQKHGKFGQRVHKGSAHVWNLCLKVVCVSFLAWMLGCASSGETPVPDETSLTITATPQSVTNFGDTALLTTQAVLADGHVVVDGTRVTLTLVSGDGFLRTASEQGSSITLTTTNGETNATYVSGETTESATITARTGTIGGDGSISVTIEVTEKYGDPQLVLSPNNLFRTGGETVLTLLVTDPNGKPLPGEVVTFSSDRGILASNGTPIRTDPGGAARDTLFLNQPSDDVIDVNITAAVGNKTSQGAVSISDNENPVPVIVVSPSTIIREETVFLDAANSTDDDGDIISYQWWFGDGNTGSGITIQHDYEEDGVYTVLLLVTDDAGATMGVTEDIFVGDYTAPTAAFTTSPSAPRVNVPMFFNAESSSDTDGTIESYYWDFGDGTTGDEGPLTSHTYLVAETYTVTLEVTDNDGVTATTSTTVTVVGNTAPTASFSFSPSSPTPDQDIAFDATASADTDGEIVSYLWDFGDGTSSNEGPLVRHQYREDGTYEVFLTVTDNEGGQGFVTQEVIVAGSAPTATFTASNTTPAILEKVGFDATGSTDTDGDIVSYRWDFGDGYQVYSSTPLTRHGYQNDGEYTVFLEVTDDSGLKGYFSSTISVSANVAPTASFTTSNATPDLDEPVIFDATKSTDTEGNIVSYLWDFGDGRISTQGPVVTHAYTTAGIYAAVLTVTDENGAIGSTGTTITVASTNAAPTASFSWSPTSPTSSDVITFDATLSSDSDGDIVEYIWEFSSSSGVNSHTTITEFDPIIRILLPAGTTLVFLTVMDNEGSVGYLTQEVTVTESSNVAPTAAFIFAPVSPSAGATVSFFGESSSDSDGSIIQYTWFFGDDSSGSGETTTHVYDADGTYTAQLIVEDNDGALGITSQDITVGTVNAPKARLKVLQGPSGSLILDATATSDPEDSLDQLTFTFEGFTSNGAAIPMPEGKGPLLQVTPREKRGALSLVATVENRSGVRARHVQNIALPFQQKDLMQPGFHVNPIRIPAPGGNIDLNTWNAHPRKSVVNTNVMGTAKVQTAFSSGGSQALIQGGQPGDKVTFRLLTPDAKGRMQAVTRTVELTRSQTVTGPKARLETFVKPGANLEMELTAPPQPGATYLFKGYAARSGVTVSVTPNPLQPHKARAVITGAAPGDYLVFHLQVEDQNGFKDTIAHGVRIPKPEPVSEGGLQ